MARRAPLPLAISTARSTAALSPETTTWPPPLSLAAWQTWPLRGLGRDRHRLVEVEPQQRRHGAGADRHRLLHGAAADAQAAAPYRRRSARRRRRAPNTPRANVRPRIARRAQDRRRPRLRSTRSAASDTAISAGCAFSVSVSVSAGPSQMMLVSFSPSAASTSSNTARAGAKASARALPMPTVWLPWPGNMNATRHSPPPEIRP